MKPKNRNSQAARNSRRNHDIASGRAGLENTERSINRSGFGAHAKAAEFFGSDANKPRLKIIPLGGLGEVGRNLNIIEYGDDAVILDAGLRLGVDMPGVNYGIPEFKYIEKIKSKIKGIIFTHGHLDHIGAMPHLKDLYKLPVYGSRFTLDMLERLAVDRDPNAKLNKRYINPDNHEQVVIGPFKLELVRVTHSIPDPCAAVIDTPVGKIVHTGDFRLDPNPLDGKVTDIDRLKKIGSEGVLMLLSDSTNCERLGRTASETTIVPTIDTLIKQAAGRIVISAVSTNVNRIQMIMDAAVKSGRKVAIDGRSMLANIELAVRGGYVKIPKGTIVAMRDITRIPDRDLAIISTGHQGELGSVLMRMAEGSHKFVKLKPTDTVIFSASPIPGNEKAVVAVVDRLMREGARVYQHVTREVDGTGPLHVSGHANRDELTEMLTLTKPKFFVPIHGEYHHQVRHAELAAHNGVQKQDIFVLNNGDVLEVTREKAARTSRVPAGMQLIDQTGELVPALVIKDRLLMSEDGIIATVLTINKQDKSLAASPDIISRGFVYMKDNEELINGLRDELKNFTARRFGKSELTHFKQELRDHINSYLFNKVNRSPIIIPVVNVIGGDRPQKS